MTSKAIQLRSTSLNTERIKDVIAHICINMKIKIKIRRTANEQALSSAEIVASVDDLLTEIFLRLPMKSLIRFKLVSKHWHSLITNPQFCLLRNPNPNPAVGLFLLHSDIRVNPRFEYVSFSVNKPNINPPFRKLNFTGDPSGIGISHSCNGLLLCSSFRARGYNPRYYIYNPTTKRFSKLPKLEPRHWNSTTIHGMSLAFDPAKSPHYKVVCVRGSESDSGEYKYQLEVYSSETGPWRKCGEPFTAQVNFEKGVYWNGSIHWVNGNGAGDSLYFNLHDEMPHRLQMPPIPGGWDWRSNYYFGESCDHLHYIELLGAQIKFNVYEMKRDYSEWLVKYHVDLSHVVASYPAMTRDNFDPTDWYYYAFSIFTLVRDAKEEDSFLVLQIPGKVVRYNLVYGTSETIHEFGDAEIEVIEGSLRFPGTNGFQHIESLCCV